MDPSYEEPDDRAPSLASDRLDEPANVGPSDAVPLLSERPTNGTIGSTVDLPIEQVAGGEIVAGTFVGRYRLIRRLGRGGTGEVWQGRDPHLGRFVAVKLIRPDLFVSSELREAFLREGWRLAQLAHPSIIEIFDVGVATDRPFLVTLFAEGGTLADRIEKSRPTARETATWLAQVARAAHFAHLQGVVHRDVKPSNILLDGKGQALLGDFGLAISEEEQVHERPSTLGTYAFMSPEQLRGASHIVDGRADIYSLGVTLYLCLTGRLPFLADTPVRYRKLVLEREPRPLRSVDDSIDAGLESICLKCLAREPGARYTTALDLAVELEGWVSRRRRDAARLRPLLATAVLACGGLAAIGGGIDYWRASRPEAAVVRSIGAAADSDPEHDSSTSAFDGDLRPLSPSEAGAAIFQVRDGEGIAFSSDRDALLRLGTQPDGPARFSLDVVRSKPVGSGGVFWGYRVEERDGKRQIRWMACGITTIARTIHQLYVAEFYVSADVPHMPVQYVIKRKQQIAGAVSPTTRIDVRDFDGSTKITLMNGNDLLIVNAERDPQDAFAIRPTGEFGLYCDGANLAFQKLMYERP